MWRFVLYVTRSGNHRINNNNNNNDNNFFQQVTSTSTQFVDEFSPQLPGASSGKRVTENTDSESVHLCVLSLCAVMTVAFDL